MQINMWPALANRSLFFTSGKSEGSCWIDNQLEKNDPKYHMDLWLSTWATSLGKVARQRYLQMIGFNIGTYTCLLLQSLNWETTGTSPHKYGVLRWAPSSKLQLQHEGKKSPAPGNWQSLILDEYYFHTRGFNGHFRVPSHRSDIILGQ